MAGGAGKLHHSNSFSGPLSPLTPLSPGSSSAASAGLGPIGAAAFWGLHVEEFMYSVMVRSEQQRHQAIFELITSELSYLRDLQLVFDVYVMKPEFEALTADRYRDFIAPLIKIHTLHLPFAENMKERQQSSLGGEVQMKKRKKGKK